MHSFKFRPLFFVWIAAFDSKKLQPTQKRVRIRSLKKENMKGGPIIDIAIGCHPGIRKNHQIHEIMNEY